MSQATFFKLTCIVNIQRSYIFNTFLRHESLVNKGEGRKGEEVKGERGERWREGVFFKGGAKFTAVD